ncbi:acyltransferase [Methanopyrus kandleri]|uniref:Acetyltransferase (The isoleucine patch superfamily) n=2 Tax=Methanopyrus kandleri TaxID=2320 RepID=Q8TWH3_METKA|nr:DapH/DapD/GlmU-related protein [Methanopyrus kandleri]AAM02274.1 Acetyltransferase (the isoleucine patch superfamily) [Methanopyrus kandleri AV19]
MRRREVLRPLREDDKYRHPAVLDEGVKIIGDNLADVTAEIGAYAEIGPSVVIRRKAAIYGFCRVFDSDVGERASISPFSIVRADVGNDAFIGDGSMIGAIGEDRAKLGYDCFIGMRCVVYGGVKVGDGAIVGAGSVVEEDVEPYTVVMGRPAEYVGDTVRISANTFVGGEEASAQARMVTRGYDTGWETLGCTESRGVNLTVVTFDREVWERLMGLLGRFRGEVDHGTFRFEGVEFFGIAASSERPPRRVVDKIRELLLERAERLVACILDCPKGYGRDVVVRSGRISDERVTGPLRARGSRYYRRTEEGLHTV